LKKKELNRLSKKLINGFTIIPVNIFINDRGLIKMTIALARGKKAPDKRQTIKERDIKRSLAV
jgi:SsrA-binding protein